MSSAAPPDGRVSRPALALFGGFLIALSLPPWGFWPLAFVGVLAFDAALGTGAERTQRAWLGFVFGAAWMFMGMGWMWHLTMPGYLFSASLFAAFHSLAAMIAPTGRWRGIGRPAAHTLAETVRLSFPFGGVPLATLGISQAGGPLLGLARVGGVILLTWVVFQVGTAASGLARSVLARVRRGDGPPTRFPRHEAVALAVVAGLVVLATIAPRGRDIGSSMTIAAVQGGGRQGTRALDVPSAQVTEAHLEATRSIAPSDDLDLVVWPENGIDVNGQPFADSQAARAITAEAARLGVPFSVGVTLDSEYAAHPVADSFVNAQVILTPDGRVVSSYEKVRIVPFGEYVPLRSLLEALGAPLEQIPADATAGRDPARIEMPDGTELGVMISWEVFFGGRARAAADAAILLNPTNGASYTGTILQTQQIASSRLRAVETGRWLVQVSPTGFSAFVSSGGDVLQRTGVSERAVITAAVPLRAGTTWYTRTGDLPWVAAVVGLVAISLWFGAVRRPQRPDDGEAASS